MKRGHIMLEAINSVVTAINGVVWKKCDIINY